MNQKLFIQCGNCGEDVIATASDYDQPFESIAERVGMRYVAMSEFEGAFMCAKCNKALHRRKK